ncbi:uncharacterized protein LACBIDRAFT_331544 [Laccaria bicolor S238N-H82]|uniref:Predicted protein n=1 Tax=Laccaria bicolor (strain S238N-H82 / ATCC MYA-4686) TaxID=486041 RepID=B0DPT3_LACBS|nr:uncharacterized protein LACBIDRAFT_331544 [Laccaria bicolor S238N-H82]EDR03509.1 predicted protein [Laccaria bicolor S238N-H82]|eukprot:XP_001885965.1 predicted protein [Laccaria bicolor S238N-H82]
MYWGDSLPLAGMAKRIQGLASGKLAKHNECHCRLQNFQSRMGKCDFFEIKCLAWPESHGYGPTLGGSGLTILKPELFARLKAGLWAKVKKTHTINQLVLNPQQNFYKCTSMSNTAPPISAAHHIGTIRTSRFRHTIWKHHMRYLSISHLLGLITDLTTFADFQRRG